MTDEPTFTAPCPGCGRPLDYGAVRCLGCGYEVVVEATGNDEWGEPG